MLERTYTCTECGREAIARSQRGPVPKTCELCKMDAADQRLRGWKPKLQAPGSRLARTIEAGIGQDQLGRALAMRLEFRTFDEIADELNLGSAEEAFGLVRHAMARRAAYLDEQIDTIRARELSHLERLTAETFDILGQRFYATSGGQVVQRMDENGQLHELHDEGPRLAAIATLVRISESRRKLLGLDAAQKVSATVSVEYSITGIPESEMP